MGLFVPSGAAGRNLDALFAKKVPKIKDNKCEKWLVGAKILAYLKWLIYSAAFNDPTAVCRAMQIDQYGVLQRLVQNGLRQ